jgi:hypothetical protein
VLYELLYGRTPFRGLNRKETFYWYVPVLTEVLALFLLLLFFFLNKIGNVMVCASSVVDLLQLCNINNRIEAN